MSLLECLRTALAALAQNKVRSALTTLGVIIGVVAVVLLVSLGTAAQKFIEQQFEAMGSYLITVMPGKQETTGMLPVIGGSVHKLTAENAKEVRRKVQGIKGVAPLVIGAGKVKYGDRERDITIVGTSAEFLVVRRTHVDFGRFFTEREAEQNSHVCVIGLKVEQELFGNQSPLYQRITVNRTKFLVIGVMEHRGMTLGIDLDDIVFVPVSAAQQMFYGGEDTLFEMLILPRSHADVERATESIREILLAAHNHTEDFTILDERSMLASFRRIFMALRFMLAGLASISLLVGGIGIMNIMLVSVRERIREVGIRKAVGARRRDIGLQFLIESMALGGVGGVLGIFGGWVGTTVLRALYPSLPAYLSLWAILTAFLFSLAVGVFFGVYPAFKAASVDPVEALRYE
jgi:ABC-type antimicrobial peptide transport system permease subunit